MVAIYECSSFLDYLLLVYLLTQAFVIRFLLQQIELSILMIFLLGLFTSIFEWKWQWQITFGVRLNELYASLGNYTIHYLLSGKWQCFRHGPWVRSESHDHPSPSYCFAVLFSLLGIVQKNAKRYKCEVYYCVLCAFQTSNIETDQETWAKGNTHIFLVAFLFF